MGTECRAYQSRLVTWHFVHQPRRTLHSHRPDVDDDRESPSYHLFDMMVRDCATGGKKVAGE
jgi:hypothetical protein